LGRSFVEFDHLLSAEYGKWTEWLLLKHLALRSCTRFAA